MKWKNKGHEYDIVYEKIKKLKGIYLLGAGHDGLMVKDILCDRYNSIEILGYIDNDVKKQGTTYQGLMVSALDDVKVEETVGIVVAFASEFTKSVDRQLIEKGWIKGRSFFHYEEFISVLAAYEYNELFMSSICVLPTTKCNLRCEACLNFTTYIKHFIEHPLEEIKRDIDLFFDNVDYVGLFFISGGEPLLYPHIADIVQYIDKQYGDKIYSFETVTNGTVKPSSEFLKVLQNTKIKITVDDYRDVLLDQKEKFEENLEQLYKYGGHEKVSLRKYDEWIDLYPYPQEVLKDDELVKKYDMCHVPWQEYRKGKLYSCNYAAFASVAEITDEIDDSEVYDLTSHKKENLKVAMEFRLGFSEKGYVEFCKKCAGYLEINEHKVKPAIQKKG